MSFLIRQLRQVRVLRNPNGFARRCPHRTISQCDKYVVSSSQYKDQHIPDQNLADYMMSDWSKFGDKIALKSFETGVSYTYSQCIDVIHRLASSFQKLGLRENDVVFMLSPNCSEYPLVYLAVVSLGAIITTNNPLYTSSEIASAVKLSKSKFMITTPELLPTVEQAIQSLKGESTVKETIVMGSSDGYRPLSSMMDKSCSMDADRFENVDWSKHLAALPFSSGTTGLPKGVMLSHTNIVSNIVQLRNCGLKIEYDDVLPGTLPMFHIYGQVCTSLVGLSTGATIVTQSKFDFVQFLEALQNERVSVAHLVPPIILGMTKSPLTDKYDLSALRVASSGAAPLKESTSIEFQEKFTNTSLLQGYGLTETSPVVAFNLPDPLNKHGSIGPLLANVTAKAVCLETDVSLPANKEGELYFYGPNIMQGYWENQEATDDCLKDGWFRTGDIGYYDEDGYFYVVDRLKELIKYKGFQVAPAELEALLISHPDILDAGVVSVENEEAGELPRAYIVIKPGHDVTDEKIHEFVKENVTAHKQLRGGIKRIDAIPKSASGKILRRILKQQAQNERSNST